MAQPLTPEQFKALQDKGLSTEQIIKFEKVKNGDGNE